MLKMLKVLKMIPTPEVIIFAAAMPRTGELILVEFDDVL
jgi:hypothetical protein